MPVCRKANWEARSEVSYGGFFPLLKNALTEDIQGTVKRTHGHRSMLAGGQGSETCECTFARQQTFIGAQIRMRVRISERRLNHTGAAGRTALAAREKHQAEGTFFGIYPGPSASSRQKQRKELDDVTPKVYAPRTGHTHTVQEKILATEPHSLIRTDTKKSRAFLQGRKHVPKVNQEPLRNCRPHEGTRTDTRPAALRRRGIPYIPCDCSRRAPKEPPICIQAP